MKVQALLAVACGGMIGALARYGVDGLLAGTTFALQATLLVNVIGAFGLGYMTPKQWANRDGWYTCLTTSFFGSFTTFSTVYLQWFEWFTYGLVKEVFLRVAQLGPALQKLGVAVHDLGNLAGPANPRGERDAQGMRNLSEGLAWSRIAHDAVWQALQQKQLPILLGGDHTNSLK